MKIHAQQGSMLKKKKKTSFSRKIFYNKTHIIIHYNSIMAKLHHDH